MGRLPPPSLFNVVKKINREGGIFDFMLQKDGGTGGGPGGEAGIFFQKLINGGT